MKVILRQDLPNLGKAGDIKEVKRGYANNYLLPKGLAFEATESNMKKWEFEKKVLEKKILKEQNEMKKLAETLSSISCSVMVEAGEDDRLFGAVTSADIAEALLSQGINIDKRKIILEEPIKQIGVFSVPVHLGNGIETVLKVWVMKK